MDKLKLQLEYEKKVTELKEMVANEAKNLQNIVDMKDSVTLEIRQLGEKKVQLGKTLLDLQQKVVETQDFLEQLTEKNKKAIEEGKKEFDEGQKKVQENKQLFQKLMTVVEPASRVASEIGEFITKEVDSRDKYLVQHEKLTISEKNYQEIELKLKTEREEIEQEKKSLDQTKKYLTDLHGKIGSYGQFLKQIIDILNEAMTANDIGLHFNVPKGEVFEVDFDNFNIKHKDT